MNLTNTRLQKPDQRNAPRAIPFRQIMKTGKIHSALLEEKLLWVASFCNIYYTMKPSK